MNNYYTYTNDSNQEIIETRDLHAANFTNCIFGGNGNIEFILDKAEGSSFNFNIRNSMIQFNDTNNDYENNAELDFSNSSYQNTLLNGVPNFRNPEENDFIIGQNSDAVGKALPTVFTLDILGIDRSINPDIGAYQHIIFE